MEWLADPAIWIAFLTLTLLELVLGIDNIVFISILAGKLPPEQQSKARYIGLALALVMRVLLLFSLSRAIATFIVVSVATGIFTFVNEKLG